QGEAVSVLPDGPWRAIVRRVSRRPGAALATALSVLLLVVVTASAATVSSLQAAVDADQQALQVTARLGTVERRAGAIETEVLRFGRLLEGISTATTVALSQTQPEDARPWLVLDPTTAPDDLVDSAVDGATVSLRTPVFRSAPSADPLALQPVFRRLTRLDGTLRRTLLRSAPGGGVTWDLAEARRIHLSGDTPVRRLRVALTDGTELVFPGQAEAAIEDPREASWYQRSADQPFPHWEPPTLDAMGRVVVVVGRSIYAEDDPRFLGVASAEIVVDRTLAKLLAEHDADLLHQWVVDGSGRVIGSDEGPGKLQPAPVDGLDELLDDHLTTWREESDGIVVTAPLPQLGWALVARYGASPRDRR
ncbi:MAG: cache domain-containing protein, partial [Myxococcales bacterium]|nr:cache domain-containing protein [Myxococcales bacterium]